MPPNQSRPWAPWGASPATLIAATTRSGNRAAQARAWGPPPECPITANCRISSASAMAATSVAAEARFLPGTAVEPP